VDGQYFFEDDTVKEVCRKMMRALAMTLDIDIITYCWMSNHSHILLGVPDKETLQPLTEEEWLERLAAIYDANKLTEIRQQLQRAREQASTPELAGQQVAKILDKLEARRGDVSNFMKELNQRISIYINKRNNRKGTLWQEPFRSVLVEGNEGALLAMAVYIDLNPVRAGMVDKPEDYRFCGYAEALSGNRLAKKGLGSVLREALIDESFKSDWRRTHNRYRLFLYTEGEAIQPDPETGNRGRKGFSEEKVEAVVNNDGALPIAETLLHRVRYFSDGAVIGTAAYIEEVFQRNRSHFGPSRTTGARRMRGANWGNLRALRDLRTDVISP
jgi:REP element-mobilizing transposase RayT